MISWAWLTARYRIITQNGTSQTFTLNGSTGAGKGPQVDLWNISGLFNGANMTLAFAQLESFQNATKANQTELIHFNSAKIDPANNTTSSYWIDHSHGMPPYNHATGGSNNTAIWNYYRGKDFSSNCCGEPLSFFPSSGTKTGLATCSQACKSNRKVASRFANINSGDLWIFLCGG